MASTEATVTVDIRKLQLDALRATVAASSELEEDGPTTRERLLEALEVVQMEQAPDLSATTVVQAEDAFVPVPKLTSGNAGQSDDSEETEAL